jgi:flagellar motor switch protein FliN/FliY
MATDVEFTPFGDDAGPDGMPLGADADLARLTDVMVELTVEVGRTRMKLGETMSLGPGSVVTLDRLADKPVDLLVSGRSKTRCHMPTAPPVLSRMPFIRSAQCTPTILVR